MIQIQSVMFSRLLSLPSEIRSIVFGFLDPEDFWSVRGVNKQFAFETEPHVKTKAPSRQRVCLADVEAIPWASDDRFIYRLDTLILAPYLPSKPLIELARKKGLQIHQQTKRRQIKKEQLPRTGFARLTGIQTIIVLHPDDMRPSSWCTERQLRKEATSLSPLTKYDPIGALALLLDILQKSGVAETISTIEYHNPGTDPTRLLQEHLSNLPGLSRLDLMIPTNTLGHRQFTRYKVNHHSQRLSDSTCLTLRLNARKAQLAPWQIQKTRIIIHNLRWPKLNAPPVMLELPCDIKRLWKHAKTHFNFTGASYNSQLRIIEIDNVSYEEKGFGDPTIRYDVCAGRRLGIFLQDHVQRAAFWSERHGENEFCDVICSFS